MATRIEFILIVLFFFPSTVLAQYNVNNLLTLTDKVYFEEENDFINNSLIYTIDQNSNIIGTDLKRSKISIFDSSGKFINQFGEIGKGPGDFEYPTSSIRLNDGTLLISEFSGRLSLFSENGNSFIKVLNTDIFPLMNVKLLDDKRLLLIGRKTGDNASYLHIYNLSETKIEKSFLELPFMHSDYAQAFRMLAQLVVADVYYDRIIAAVTPFDMVYIFSMEGKLLNTKKINLENFKHVSKNTNSLSREDLLEYTTTFSIIDKLYVLPDGTLLIQYSRMKNINTNNPDQRDTEYNLALISNDDWSVLFEIEKSPTLVAVDMNDSSLFFKDEQGAHSYLLKGYLKR